jgi:hypothetical protein
LKLPRRGCKPLNDFRPIRRRQIGKADQADQESGSGKLDKRAGAW